MSLRKTVLRGITEVGAVRSPDGVAPAEDVSFGSTAPNGATVSFQPNQLEVESGQSTFLEDIFVTSNRVEVTLRLIFANLANVKEVLGLTDEHLTGSLVGDQATRTAEKLVIPEDGIGAREDHLYLITPGPFGSRRYDLFRTKVKGNLTLELSRDQHIIVEGTWAVLRAGAGVNPVEIEDLP